MLDKILEWFPEEEILKADGFDEAIIGIDIDTIRLIYSTSKCCRNKQKQCGGFTFKYITNENI